MLRTINKAAILLLLFLVTGLASESSISTSSSEALELEDAGIDEQLEENYLDSEVSSQSEWEEPDLSALQGARVLRHRARHYSARHGGITQENESRDFRILSSKGSRSFSRSFLDPDIEPRPFINCIPVGPSQLPPSRSGMSAKGRGSKANRRKSRSMHMMSSTNSRRNLKGIRRRGFDSSSSESDDSIGRGIGVGVRKGMGRGGGRKRLPYCPLPTFEPTYFPTLTPIPTFTPLPTITPFPSFTPFPTIESTDETPAPTIAPTVSSQPSLRPSVSSAPSTSRAPTGKPTDFSSGPTVRTVAGRLAYGFMPGTTIREPTTEELTGLIDQTKLFYTNILSAAYSSYSSLDITDLQQTYDADGTYPVILDFNLPVTFSTNSAGSPSDAEVFNTVNGANYESYITMHVWASEPLRTSLFYDTQRVVFTNRGAMVV